MQDGKQAKTGEEDDLEDLEDDEETDTEKKPIKMTFELNDTLYAEAELENTDTVYLWLGVNMFLKSSTNVALINIDIG